MKPTIQTYTGLDVDPFTMCTLEVRIKDIAHALSQLCRFNGHTQTFYSVAQHSVLVSRRCTPENALYGLLHDASEAFLSDLPTPLKVRPEFATYRAAEKRLQNIIYLAFGLEPEEPTEVKHVDKRVFVTEARDLMTNPIPYGDHKPYPCKVRALTPALAEAMFLNEFHLITNQNR